MKPCTGCRHLNSQYYRGPICMIAHEDLPKDPYTGQQMIKLGFVDRARSEGGICGPDATRYEPKLWRRFWNFILRKQVVTQRDVLTDN